MPAPLLIVVGLVALVVGAEFLVRGGSHIATRLRISPIVVGLTVVSLGTSMPELAIAIEAARTGSSGLAIGNIVGTNIVNILLILGLSALLRPLTIESRTVRLDLPAMAVASAVLFVMSLDGGLGLLDGAVLLALAAAYTWVVLRSARVEAPAVEREFADEFREDEPAPPGRLPADLAALVGGIVVIVAGAQWLVDGSVDVATALGVSETVIGLTIVAVGTSAPELVTTLVSTIRGNRDIAIGNLLGSSVYNIVFILGATIVAAPYALPVAPAVLWVDMVVMLVVALVCIPTFLSGRRITRFEGGVFVAAYLAYLAYLLVART
ncbi:calcium/sodium antiporter [Tessaracoccus terricola]